MLLLDLGSPRLRLCVKGVTPWVEQHLVSCPSTPEPHEGVRARGASIMGLGNRTAHRHQTTAASKAAGYDSSVYWDYQPGQRVMTVDGFPGTISAVQDGPLMGTEAYIVVLANGLGGGEYTASQLTATNEVTASEVHTADMDYPELGTILVDRPDIAPNT